MVNNLFLIKRASCFEFRLAYFKLILLFYKIRGLNCHIEMAFGCHEMPFGCDEMPFHNHQMPFQPQNIQV